MNGTETATVQHNELRFDEKTRTLNAVTFAVMTVFSSGISMYAMGRLLNFLLGWSFNVSVLVAVCSPCSDCS